MLQPAEQLLSQAYSFNCSSVGTFSVVLLRRFNDAVAVYDAQNIRGAATCETKRVLSAKCLLAMAIGLENHTQSIFPLDGRRFERQILY
jgi:hypothetical protein